MRYTLDTYLPGVDGTLTTGSKSKHTISYMGKASEHPRHPVLKVYFDMNTADRALVFSNMSSRIDTKWQGMVFVEQKDNRSLSASLVSYNGQILYVGAFANNADSIRRALNSHFPGCQVDYSAYYRRTFQAMERELAAEENY